MKFEGYGEREREVLGELTRHGGERGAGSGIRSRSAAIAAAERWGAAGLAEAQDFVVAAVADLQILKKTTFLEGKSEERDIVAGEEEDFARVVKVSVVSGGVGEGIARW
ncbi:hypothetical protein ACFX2C_005603 [Malus domestica]